MILNVVIDLDFIYRVCGPAARVHTAPPLRGLRADTINQKNVIIRLNTLRLHGHTHTDTHTQKQHYM